VVKRRFGQARVVDQRHVCREDVDVNRRVAFRLSDPIAARGRRFHHGGPFDDVGGEAGAELARCWPSLGAEIDQALLEVGNATICG
jgi:hypothetical protein